MSFLPHTIIAPREHLPLGVSGENVGLTTPAEWSEINAPSVSVIIPSYQHAPFIARCLRSVIKQTSTPLELIVIDDGSSDDSPKIIERTLKECSFSCELIVRPHRGLCATLNEGLVRSRGKYFAYLGSDDAWLPQFLQARVELLESRREAVLAYGHTYIINEHDQIIECTLDWCRYTDGSVLKMLLNHTVPLSPSVLYRRGALERNWWNEEAGLEDYELYLRLCMDGDFAFDPQPLAAWRKHRYNTSRNLSFMLDECLKAQYQVVGKLGITQKELKKAHSALKWRYAGDFIKTGQKSKALGLIYHNLRGAPSSSSVAKMLVALAVPQRALRWRRHILQHTATKNYGTIQI